MSILFKYTSVIGLFCFLTACKPAEVLTQGADALKLPKIKDKELVDRIDSLSHLEPKTFYSKLNVTYQEGEKEISLKTSVKIVSDSAVNAIITYAKIPVVTAMVTKDSVSVVNKRDRCYSVASLDFLKETFGVDFSYENLEEIIYGKPLDYRADQKYFVDNDPFHYSVSTHKKRDRKRPDRKQRDDLMIQYQLSDDALHLKQTRILSIEDSTEIVVAYQERQILNGFDLPVQVKIDIKTPKKTMVLLLFYDRVEVNEPQELIIIIPESYEKCD
ncbi:MAG: hypothetical protein RLZZ65_318 [Bacteroidota bacterium]|jgi:hypothetical protein